jgi:hypothetical protein
MFDDLIAVLVATLGQIVGLAEIPRWSVDLGHAIDTPAFRIREGRAPRKLDAELVQRTRGQGRRVVRDDVMIQAIVV